MVFHGQKVNIVRTRYKPKRADEMIASGGSIYRVIKGQICCRQRIIGFDTMDDGQGGSKCLILVDMALIRTLRVAKRPFQGWRYLNAADAPADLGPYNPAQKEDDPALQTQAQLVALGLL
jgi:hypothetical protein